MGRSVSAGKRRVDEGKLHHFITRNCVRAYAVNELRALSVAAASKGSVERMGFARFANLASTAHRERQYYCQEKLIGSRTGRRPLGPRLDAELDSIDWDWLQGTFCNRSNSFKTALRPHN